MICIISALAVQCSANQYVLDQTCVDCPGSATQHSLNSSWCRCSESNAFFRPASGECVSCPQNSSFN